MNNFVGKGSNTQVVLFNLRIILKKTSQEMCPKRQCIFIIIPISTNEYAGRQDSRRGNSILII